MFTRCPECLAVHQLSSSLLAHADGRVRCGNCDQEFNALATLFDHWPDSKSNPPAASDDAAPPTLGTDDAIAGTRDDIRKDAGDHEGFPDEAPDEARPGSSRLAWSAVFVVLLVITLSNIAWTFRESLSSHPVVRSLLVNAGLMEASPAEPYRDTSRLHLVSRDMHKHPTRSGMLALSVTFVNRAIQAQPYPQLEVTLTNASGLGLARREFGPAEYLTAAAGADQLLAPNVHVQILLEFVDPGSDAVGFEITFR